MCSFQVMTGQVEVNPCIYTKDQRNMFEHLPKRQNVPIFMIRLVRRKCVFLVNRAVTEGKKKKEKGHGCTG